MIANVTLQCDGRCPLSWRSFTQRLARATPPPQRGCVDILMPLQLLQCIMASGL